MQPAAFIDFISCVPTFTPQQLARLSEVVARSRQRAEAVMAIDDRCATGEAGGACPRCSCHQRCRWGRTRTGAQRWRCRDCGATWCGMAGTPLMGIRRSAAFVNLLRNMLTAEKPWSCRRAANSLGISRHTAWRWRMRIIRALPAERPGSLAGIVEADEARQRESRKGSREWVRFRADPANHPRPPREPWHYYFSRAAAGQAPPGGWSAWNRNLLAATDRAGHRVFEAIENVGEGAVSRALLPPMAPDAVLCTDGHATCEKIARTARLTHFALNAGRRPKRMPKTHHINTVNALISRYRNFIRPFCGPASRNLTGYGRWHAARENARYDYIRVFKSFLGSTQIANTLC